MPPPHLHPRSRMTSSLFAVSIFASFFVVALPHALPCPAPRIALADGQVPLNPDGTPQRRRRRRRSCSANNDENTTNALPAATPIEVQRGADGMAQFSGMTGNENDSRIAAHAAAMNSRKHVRECPVPKPQGLLGELLGFKSDSPSNDKS